MLVTKTEIARIIEETVNKMITDTNKNTIVLSQQIEKAIINFAVRVFCITIIILVLSAIAFITTEKESAKYVFAYVSGFTTSVVSIILGKFFGNRNE